ncbi:MAG: hypothetical protein EPN41_00865 [Candidimonas sp.]|nr:MAG: hypothetical protein EPN41_00865 [Candidimonas sp.]
MRLFFLLILIANIALLAYGQGFFGPPPSESGRTPQPFQQSHQTAVTLGAPRATIQAAPQQP